MANNSDVSISASKEINRLRVDKHFYVLPNKVECSKSFGIVYSGPI